MNLPNKLTISRFLFTFILLVFLFNEFPYHETVALILFVIASMTDFWDGYLARRDKLITNFGILMDPLADKVLICSLFIAFVGLDLLPAWMAIIVVFRELAITGLRLLAASKNVVLAAEGFGKHKTGSQITAVSAIFLSICYPEWGTWGTAICEQPILWGPWLKWFTTFSIWLAVILTLISGYLYLWKNREIYLDDT